jgi:hypothetical protein
LALSQRRGPASDVRSAAVKVLPSVIAARDRFRAGLPGSVSIAIGDRGARSISGRTTRITSSTSLAGVDRSRGAIVRG